ncbi:hypothetical protein QCA50_012840 [Cerrena zonata]|uniref:Uncharacterized protein n=1 Tax=Cerrena zonata TaxID=2478898 RepID=A0AAW0FXR2_9APHY
MTLRKSICTSRPVSRTARKTISASHASDEDGSDHDSDESLSSNEPAAIDNVRVTRIYNAHEILTFTL